MSAESLELPGPLDALAPVDRRTAVRPQVYERLRQAIISLALRPRERISETDLEALLRVSRTPVREACVRLAEEGLVDVFPQSGTWVAGINLERVRGAQFVRESLECAVIERAIDRASSSDHAALRELIVQQEAANAAHDFDRFYALDEQLHESFSRIGGVPLAWKVAQSEKAHLDRIRRLSLPLPRQLTLLIDEHRRVVEALCSGDVIEAIEVLRMHLRGALRLAPSLAERYPDYFDTSGSLT